jgi:hypothetical protein
MRRSRQLFLSFLTILPIAMYVACSDDSGPGASSGTLPDGALPDGQLPTSSSSSGGPDNPDADVTEGGGPDAGPVRGPATIDFPEGSDPNSLYYDDATNKIFISDNNNNQVWTWSEKSGLQKAVVMPNSNPTGPFPTQTGQIVILADGTIVVPRFGKGVNGGIEYSDVEGLNNGEVPGTDPTLKRVALGSAETVNGSGKMFGSTFVNNTSTDDAGVITTVTVSGETPYAVGFQKVVSVLVKGQQLFATDQGRNVIYVLPTDGGAGINDHVVFANVQAPDTTVEGPNNTILTGQFKVLVDGGALQVRQISADGQTVKAVDTGKFSLSKPKGLAYDKVNKRLFIADSDGLVVRTVKIVPLQ